MIITSDCSSRCGSGPIKADGRVQVVAVFRSNLTHAEYDRLVDNNSATNVEFLVCSWRHGEPIIHGFANEVMAAWRMAQSCIEGGKYKDDELEICSRVPQETLAWRGLSGRVVTVEHVRALDN